MTLIDSRLNISKYLLLTSNFTSCMSSVSLPIDQLPSLLPYIYPMLRTYFRCPPLLPTLLSITHIRSCWSRDDNSIARVNILRKNPCSCWRWIAIQNILLLRNLVVNCRLFNCGPKSLRTLLKYYTRMVSLNFFSSRYDKQSFYRNCETIIHSIIVQNTFNGSGCTPCV